VDIRDALEVFALERRDEVLNVDDQRVHGVDADLVLVVVAVVVVRDERLLGLVGGDGGGQGHEGSHDDGLHGDLCRCEMLGVDRLC
jgi:hypothetical protein